MDILLKEALNNYNFNSEAVTVDFIRHNENATYKITDNNSKKQFVLRIHKSSCNFSLDIFGVSVHSINSLRDEMNLINAIEENTDIPVQKPVKDINRNIVTTLKDGTPCTLLSWVDGTIVEENQITDEILYNIGLMVAKLHSFSIEWSKINKLERYSYDEALLDKIRLKLQEGYEIDAINQEKLSLINNVIDEICNCIHELDKVPNSKGIVHSDLSKSNLIVCENKIIPIDFCLSGYSYFYMDLGSLYSHFDKAEQQKVIKEGYLSLINIELNNRFIEAFFIFQIILFIGTHIRSIANTDWFPKALNRWSDNYFTPFVLNKSFLTN